jgi:two-component system cell cycle response regulator
MTMRVLVVDDIPVNVILLAERLKLASYQVVTATSGEEALKIIRQSPPDIVLLDVMMPGMSGYEVCQRIRQEEKTAGLPVVMVTALDKDSDRQSGIDAGADEFLTKPVDDDVLFPAMQRATRKRSQP